MFISQIPRGCSELHHEVELGVVISEKCSSVPENAAMRHVAGYALALDMTARDFQVGMWYVMLRVNNYCVVTINLPALIEANCPDLMIALRCL